MSIWKSLKILIVFLAVGFIAVEAPVIEDSAPPSIADHLHLSRAKDPVDGGWLPNLTGLPDKNEIKLISKHVNDVMQEDTDAKCTAIDPKLRMMVFQHFAIYQQMANAQHIYLNEDNVQQWAHVLGMILKESSGDTSNITDMRGHTMTTNRARTDLEHWLQILQLSHETPVSFNEQTNFGLLQASADRLFVAFNLAKSQKYITEFLEGREGADTPRKINLNTAIAIRRLIWFYQDMAQGRITQSDARIHYRDIGKAEFSERYQQGIRMALKYCGTKLMFSEGEKNEDLVKLDNAMASIAYCKLGNAQQGYGKNEFDQKCFAEWVTLCPALNVDIAMLIPISYFQTRHTPPICQGTFQKLLTKNPEKTLKALQINHNIDLQDGLIQVISHQKSSTTNEPST